jgi:aldehyde:ferredoxin oxidoreductase
MIGGYTKRILKIDLSQKKIEEDNLKEEMAKAFISGRGLGDKILFDELEPKIDPLSPDNIIILSTGALVGTDTPFCSRSYITTKSPLSNTILMNNSGGYLGPELKFAGFDAVVIKGKAKDPSYIWINDNKIEIRSAKEFWNYGTRETQKNILEETDKKAQIACIGPAAVNLVKFACIKIGDRTFGRGGCGAVFASKNLKAIAVRGSRKIDVAFKNEFDKLLKQILNDYQNHDFIQEWRKFGTPYIVGPMNELGIFPTRNFQTGLFEGHEKINAQSHKKHVVKHITCYRCPVACNSWSVVENGEFQGSKCRGPEYETLWALGGQCGNSNLESIIAANTLCDDLGMDTESTGSSIGFAMELFERGILTKRDTGNLELNFGNYKSLVKLVEMIGNREGFGAILADGVKLASERIGKDAHKFAMHVKGLEMDGYDPRGAKAQALSFATASRGGCHHSGYAKQELYDAKFDRFTEKGKGKLTKENEDETAFIDSTGFCAFPHQLGVISNDIVSKILYAVTGMVEFKEVDYLLKAGERIINIERLFNLREGISIKDDVLPERFLTNPMPTGNSKSQIVDFYPMREEYYNSRGWDDKGVPTISTLKRLSLA